MVMLTSKENRRRNFAMMVADWKRSGRRSKDIAIALDMAPSYVNQMLSGNRDIGDATARKIEEKCNLKRGALDAFWAEPQVSGDSVYQIPFSADQVARTYVADEPDDEWTDVRAHSQSVGLGDGREAAEYAETRKLKFRVVSLRRKGLSPHTLSVVFGRGDSMLPRIRDGDAILFDTSDKVPRDGRIYVVQIDGPRGPEYSAKRCVEVLGRIAFEAINPDGDHQWSKPRAMDDPKRPIEILGRVRWIGSWED
jgi:phage repressor protein C with HTH and peptisase S24 domain